MKNLTKQDFYSIEKAYKLGTIVLTIKISVKKEKLENEKKVNK